MTRERLNELWPVMEHFKNGGEVEARPNSTLALVEWGVVPNPVWVDHCDYRVAQPKPMTFMEAVEAMKQGKRVRKKSWANPEEAIHMHQPGSLIVFLKDGKAWPCMASAVTATDWEVVK